MCYDVIIFAKVWKIVQNTKFTVHNFVVCAKFYTFVHRNNRLKKSNRKFCIFKS